MMEAGVYFNVDREKYDRLTEVNWSTLKHMGKSAAHYRQNLLKKQKDTKARKGGRCTHMATLEPERWASEVAIWDAGIRRGKKWDAFAAKHEGCELLSAEEAKECQDIADAVRADATAKKYVSAGKAEATVIWTDSETGIACKCRPDFIADAGALVDLKTTRDASPEGFGKEVWRYGYHIQAAWYADGYEAATGKRLPFVLVAVEKEAPFVVQCYRVPDVVLQLGREHYRALLEHLAFCRRESKWLGYFEGEAELELPRWAVSFADDDADGLDLEFGDAA